MTHCRLSIALPFLSLFFYLSSAPLFPLLATTRRSCTTTPDFSLPLASVFNPKNNSAYQKDCGIIPEDPQDPLFLDYINQAIPLCVDDPNLALSLIQGDVSKIKPRKEGQGKVSYNPANLPNFNLNPEAINDNPIDTFPARAPASFFDMNNPALFRSTYMSLGANNAVEGAELLNRSLENADGTSRPNLLATDPGSLSRLLTRDEYILHFVLPRAQEIRSCCNGSAPANQQCDHMYQLGETGLTSCDLAQKTPDSLDSFKTLPTFDQDQIIRGLIPSTAPLPIYLVLIPHFAIDCHGSLVNWLACQFNDSSPRFVRFEVYGLKGTSTTSALTFARALPTTQSETSFAQISAAKPAPLNLPKNSSAFDYINAKIAQKGSCQPLTFSSNFTGGLAPAPNTGAASLLWSFFGNIKDLIDSQPTIFKYEVWLVVPHEASSIESFFNTDQNALPKAYLPQKLAQSLKTITNPLPIRSTDSSANIQDTYQEESPPFPCPSGAPDPDGDGLCTRTTTETATVSWSSPTKDKTYIPGSIMPLTDTLAKRGLLSSNLSEYYRQCYAAETQSRLPILNTITQGLDSNLSPYDCDLNPFSNSHSNLSGDICDIASEYRVPCQYLEAIWLIESSKATECSAANPYGPMEIEDGALNAVDPNHELDRCSLPDAWVLGARVLLWKKCGSNWNSGSCSINFSLDPNSADLQTVGQYNGANGCQPNLVTQCRWGAGKSYCDAVISLTQNGSFPGSCDPNMCRQFRCSQPGPAIECQGQIITCN